MSDLRSIGIFGGTFDPVHNGHVMVARAALEELELDRLLIVPAAQSPFKSSPTLASAEARLTLLHAAFEDLAGCEVDGLELDRQGVSYTIETVRTVAKRYPDATLYCLIGADHVATLKEWREAEALAEAVTFVVVPRPGESAVQFPKPFRGKRLQGEPMAVSASEIRERLRSGKAVTEFVPSKVARLLNSMQIY